MLSAASISQDIRYKRISQVANSIKQSILAGQTHSYEEIFNAAMARLCVSRRTAREYTDAALFQLGITKEDLKKGVSPDFFSSEQDPMQELNNIINGKPKDFSAPA